jgi:hypothetical protein
MSRIGNTAAFYFVVSLTLRGHNDTSALNYILQPCLYVAIKKEPSPGAIVLFPQQFEAGAI